MIGCLRTRVHKQPIIVLYFECMHNSLIQAPTQTYPAEIEAYTSVLHVVFIYTRTLCMWKVKALASLAFGQARLSYSCLAVR